MKKSVGMALALIMCLTSVTYIRADELTDAQKNLNNINDSISDKKDELNNINKQKDSTEKNLKDIEEKMKNTSSSLSELNSKMYDLNTQIESLENQIKENTSNLSHQNELFKKRIRAIYINGNESYLDILLRANDFSDFFNRMDSVAKLMEYDRKLMKDIEDDKKALEAEKAELQKKKGSTSALKQQADVKLNDLQAVSDKKKDIMAELTKNKAAYEQMIDEEEQQSKAIAAMVKQIQKKKSEEQKTKPSGQTNQSNNSNKGGTSSNTSNTTNNTNNNSGSGSSSSIGKLYCVTGKKTYITSPYGWRVHPVLGTKRFHAGIDIGVFSGTSIYALTDGEVIYSGWMSGYGNVVMIEHGSLTSVYGHNSSLVVKVGQKVKGGQLISYSGNTGLSSGPHLHFEMRKENGETIDPNPYYVK